MTCGRSAVCHSQNASELGAAGPHRRVEWSRGNFGLMQRCWGCRMGSCAPRPR